MFATGTQCKWLIYMAALTWVTIARVGQSPANNVSVVLGLHSYVTYECSPLFVLGLAMVVIAVVPFWNPPHSNPL
jgi:hypothetical protein